MTPPPPSRAGRGPHSLRCVLSTLALALASCGAEPPRSDPGPEDCAALEPPSGEAFRILERRWAPAEGRLPAHCRVLARIPENVHVEVRLPRDWNGRFLMVGNGGYLGMFFDQSLGLVRRYATASTDTGHQGPDPSFALDDRAAEIDFAWRAVQVSARAAKRLIAAHYGSPPAFSYFRGCSTGGRQGLVAAQRYPELFDGYSIGAPVFDYTAKQTFNAAWVAQAMFGDGGRSYVPYEKLPALGAAVYARCDAADGLEDGIIDDPRRCDFEPARDLEICAGEAQRDDCFTPAQIETIEKIYDGPGDDRYPGHVVGGEWLDAGPDRMSGGWDTYITGRLQASGTVTNTVGQMDRDPYGGDEFLPVQLRNAQSFFRYFAFREDRPDFDVLTDLDFDALPDTSYSARLMDATSTDLDRARALDRKLLVWHGWADVGLNPLATIGYYEAVRDRYGAGTDRFLRLFMVPGMYHCEGGPGPDVFDDLGALASWVEEGKPPERITAWKTRGENDFYPERRPGNDAGEDRRILRSRPLCPYPEVARYEGEGSIDEARNFVCRHPDDARAPRRPSDPQ